MNRYSYAAVTLGLVSVAIPLRAANGPHAGTDGQNPVVWTNDDLARFNSLGLISIVGQSDEEKPASAFLAVDINRIADIGCWGNSRG
jgi:hypothetical protein